MKNRFICLLLAVLLCLSIFGCAAEPPLKETPVEDFHIGFTEKGAQILEYKGTEKHIVIPAEADGVPVVSTYMSFYGLDIESVVFPDSVTDIYDMTFKGCKNLKSVTFGDGLKTIGYEAFYGCSSLEAIDLPDGVEKISGYAFYGCSSAKTLRIPGTVKEWEGTVQFFGLESLEELVLEDGLESLKGYAMFSGPSKVTSLTIPASMKELGEKTIGYKSIESVTFLGDAPETVGDSVFGDRDTNFTIYYDEDTAGWEDTPLREYTLKAR